jgi:two-component system KDP operon response regulator KdpE
VSSILVVDDEVPFLRALQLNLEARGFTVTGERTGGEALRQVRNVRFAVIIVDLGLPDIDGIELIKRMRTLTRAPIVVLSARHTSDDKVDALDAGADDYLTKPFGLNELLARLRAALRRAGQPDGPRIVTADAFTVDLGRRQVTRNNVPIRLTPTEWAILELLVRNPGILVTQRDILTEVWGPAYVGETAYLRVYLTQLRKKLEFTPSAPRHLITEPGQGYRFEP